MSQHSSSHSPRRGAPPETPNRRLISPEERFSPSPEEVPDPFVPEPGTRRDDEMARRHIPPRERRRHARLVKKREKREAKHRLASEAARHTHRAAFERDFAATVRAEAPQGAKKTRRRVPLFLKRLLLVVACIGCVAFVVAAFTAPQFNIETVTVEGNQNTPIASLRPLVQPLIGQNLLRMKGKAVEKAALLLPTIASAHVVRSVAWPPRVKLVVEERQPFLKVGAGGNWWVVDQNGVPFRRPNANDAALYTLTAPQFAPQLRQKMDEKFWPRAALLGNAILADNKLAASGSGDSTANTSNSAPFWQLRRIYFDKYGQASLRLSNAQHREMLLRLGDAEWVEKLARARVALSYFERTGRHAEELDLVSLERPVWRPLAASTVALNNPDAPAASAG